MLAAKTSVEVATGAKMTSLSIQRCQRIFPEFNSSAASTWVGPSSPVVLPAAFAMPPGWCAPWPGVAGYAVSTRLPAIIGVLISGSPRKCDQRCLPVRSSRAKIVHDSVLKMIAPLLQAPAEGPLSLSPADQMCWPLAGRKA